MREQMLRGLRQYRPQPADEEGVRDLENAVQRLANLVVNVSALADRMERRPCTHADQARAQAARVQLLRCAARSGQEAIACLTGHLVIGAVELQSTTLTARRPGQDAPEP